MTIHCNNFIGKYSAVGVPKPTGYPDAAELLYKMRKKIYIYNNVEYRVYSNAG
jgi:hypothetical protein